MTEFGNSRFRKSAIDRYFQPESLDDRAELTARREWMVLAALGLALAAIALWGAFASVERTVGIDGVLVLAGERHSIRSGSPGVVTDIESPAGERVATGQTVVRTDAVGFEQLTRLADESSRLLEREVENSTQAGRDEALRLLDRAQTLLERLEALRVENEVVSPGTGLITAILVAPGQVIPAGAPVAEIVFGDADRLEAVAFLPREDARRIDAGMTARVMAETSEGAKTFPARLAEFTPHPEQPPGWIARMHSETAVPERGVAIRLTFPPSLELEAIQDGTPCRIEIVIERVAPFTLLFKR